MLSRRCRIQARPNLKVGLTVGKVTKEPSVSVELKGAVEPPKAAASDEAQTSVIADNGDDKINNFSSTDQNFIGNKAVVSCDLGPDQPSRNVKDLQHLESCGSTDRITENILLSQSPTAGTGKGGTNGFNPVDEGIHSRRESQRSSSTIKSPDLLRKNRKKFTGEGPLDPKKMTMHDLITWNPKNDTVMKYHAGKRSRLSSNATTIGESPAEEIKKSEAAASSVPAPKVRIADDGTLVLDESSLTVAQDKSANIWETVDEDRVVRKISSLSFRKTALRKGSPWSELENELFYIVLRATGPDFGLMHEFFPSRSRSELKNKFNKEERTNWERLKHSMSTPTLLDDSLYDKANELLNKIKEDAVKKKENQEAKRNRKLITAATIDWNEDEADLVAEAEEEISRIQEELEDQSAAARKKVRKNTKTTKNIKAKIMEETSSEARRMVSERKRRKYNVEARKLNRPPIDGLTPDFPNFKLLFDEAVLAASIALDDERVPVVKLPPHTVIRVLPEDKSQPERVLFECPARTCVPARRYMIKHQSGPGEASSGFLHLFGFAS